MKAEQGIYFCLLYFLICSTFYVFITPPLEAPDEAGHIAYINFIHSHKTIPNQLNESLKEPKQGHQPPLYYILLYSINYAFNSDRALVIDFPVNEKHLWNGGSNAHVPYYVHSGSNDVDNFFYVFRLISVLMGVINIYFVYRIALLVIKDVKLSLISVAFAATLPQFAFISGTINNDNLANLLATMCIYFMLVILSRPQAIKYYLAEGLVIGLGIMTKKTIFFVIPAIMIALILLIYVSHTEKRKKVIAGTVLSILIAAIISLPYVLHNISSYNEVIGLREEYSTFRNFESHYLLSSYFYYTFWWEFFKSFVSYPGMVNILMPKWIYIIYLAVASAVVVFFLTGLRKILRKYKTIILLLAVLLFSFAGIIYFNTILTQAQGRFLFPALAAICVVFSLGIDSIAKTIKWPLKPEYLSYSLIFVFIIADIVSLFVTYNFY
jgi:4-amino-4-deoxy-L-arabinose transferase-like glycosyltransferase